jgi:hypothetical protein
MGWNWSKSTNGPLKFLDENNIVRMSIKRGSQRVPGSEGPHVELRNASGQRVDPSGGLVSKRSSGNHSSIVWDLK